MTKLKWWKTLFQNTSLISSELSSLELESSPAIRWWMWVSRRTLLRSSHHSAGCSHWVKYFHPFRILSVNFTWFSVDEIALNLAFRHGSINSIFCTLFSGSGAKPTMISGNADFQTSVPQISQLLENLHSTRQHLNQLWTAKKSRLEQCFQLRLFEDDCEKVSLWFLVCE